MLMCWLAIEIHVLYMGRISQTLFLFTLTSQIYMVECLDLEVDGVQSVNGIYLQVKQHP